MQVTGALEMSPCGQCCDLGEGGGMEILRQDLVQGQLKCSI